MENRVGDIDWLNRNQSTEYIHEGNFLFRFDSSDHDHKDFVWKRHCVKG